MRWRNALWPCLAGAFLAIAFLARSPYTGFALNAFLLLVIMANLTSRLWLSGLDCERTVSVPILRQGEEAEISVKVANRHGWPIPWLFVEDISPVCFSVTGPTSVLAILMPGRSLSFTYKVRALRRGYHRIGPLMMETGDLFGLQKRFRTGRRQDYISVLPTVAYIETFTISARRPQGPVRITNRIYEDPSRISNLREYVPGDPLNRIHWKVSARTGDLYVKQSEPSNVLGATLMLDLFHAWYQGDDGAERIELAVTIAASMAYLLQASGEQVGLLTNARDAAEAARYEVESRDALSRDDANVGAGTEGAYTAVSPLEVPTRRTPFQALRIVENLARVLPGQFLDAGTLLLAVRERLPRDAALIVIVPNVTEDLAAFLAATRMNGFAVSVILVRNNPRHSEAIRLLGPHGVDVIHIEHERQLHEISPARIGR